MADKFYGSIEKLKAAYASIDGEWNLAGDKYIFRSKDGGIINWWSSNKTIQFQGNPAVKKKLQDLFASMKSGETVTAQLATPRKQIFIVHGHDMEARDQLELALHRLDLEPFILMNSTGGGKTLIEALEGKIGHDYASDFGIVLMTPDDTGYATKDGAEKAEPRTRQNVILETGMLLSSLTRERMAIIVKGHLEIPSDLEGIIRYGYNKHIREIVPKLCKRLQEVGFELTSDKIMNASQ